MLSELIEAREIHQQTRSRCERQIQSMSALDGKLSQQEQLVRTSREKLDRHITVDDCWIGWRTPLGGPTGQG